MEQLTFDFIKKEQNNTAVETQSIDNDFLLQDRIQKIQQIIPQYGEENFYIGFSGGKDSTVLSVLVDMAIPGNTIPRVYADTGIELNMVKQFVLYKQKEDSRIVVIKPSKSIKAILEEYGYPFKSKLHAKYVDRYQRIGKAQSVENYIASEKSDKDYYHKCPQILAYQFTDKFKLRVSDQCCVQLKELPINNWAKANNRSILMTGIMSSEGGRRENAKCLFIRNGKLKSFSPLVPMDEDWEKWFIEKYDVELCPIYYPPYNFPRSGCKGCPFALRLQDELDTLEEFFPNEKKQCEIIWKPVYDEYRRLGYRLRQEQCVGQISMFED